MTKLHDQVDYDFSDYQNRIGGSRSVYALIKDYREIAAEYQSFMKDTRRLCVEKWTTFDVVLMYLGISVLILTSLVNFSFIWIIRMNSSNREFVM